MASMNKFLLGSTLLLFFYTTNISLTKGKLFQFQKVYTPDKNIVGKSYNMKAYDFIS